MKYRYGAKYLWSYTRGLASPKTWGILLSIPVRSKRIHLQLIEQLSSRPDLVLCHRARSAPKRIVPQGDF